MKSDKTSKNKLRKIEREITKSKKDTPTPKSKTRSLKTGFVNPQFAALRKEAEEILKSKKGIPDKISDMDFPELLHEFLVYQAELEIQNEELRAAQRKLEESQSKYTDLFDFVPIGYFSFDKYGTILEVNLAGAQMLDIEKRRLVKKSFPLLIPSFYKNVFFSHLKKVFESKTKQTCELKLIKKDSFQFYAHLESIAVSDNAGNYSCRTAISDITERKLAEEESNKLSLFLQKLIDAIPAPVFYKDSRGVYQGCNTAFQKYLGLKKDQIIGKTVYDVAPKDLAEIYEQKDKDLFESKGKQIYESSVKYSDGTKHDVIFYKETFLNEDSSLGELVGVILDITERKQKEKELIKLNRTLRALSNSNQVMLHAKTESDFLKDICRIVVEDCGHAMVWIGFAEDDEAKTVRPVASAGFEEGYLETLNITWADTERGRGPTGTAIRTGKPSICRNMLTDPAFEPWRKEAINRGYASSIVLPLIGDNKAFGTINIYSREPDPFTENEVKLLSELVGDLSYGILAIRSRVAHAQAEEAIRQSEERLQFALQTSHTGAWDLNLVDHTAHRSLEHDRIFGYAQLLPQWTYEIFLEHVLPEDRAAVDGKFRQAIESQGDWSFECRIRRTDGEIRWIWAAGRHRIDSASRERRMAGIVQDITDRKQSEEALLERTSELSRSNTQLSTILDNLTEGLVIADLEGNLFHWNPAAIAMHGFATMEECKRKLVEFTKIFELSTKEEGILPVEKWPLARIMNGEKLCDWEVNVRRLDRDWSRIFGYGGTLARDKEGKPIVAVVTVADITERKTAEERLREAKEALQKANEELEIKVQKRTGELNKAYETVKAERQQLYDVLDTLPAYVVLLSPDYHVPFANRFFEERFGKSNGQRCYEYLFNRTEPCETCETYSVLKTNAPRHWEWTGPDSRNYDIYDFPFKDTDGSTLIMEVGLDITERKKAERTIKESEKKYRILVEQAAEAIAIFDQHLNFIDVNSAACQITGFTQEELLKLNVKDIVPEEDFASIPSQLAEVIAGKTVVNESRLRRKDGTIINIEVSAKMLEDGMVQTITRDITERKQAERRDFLIKSLLELFARKASRKEYLDSVTELIHNWCGCHCIGIRVVNENRYIPYESYVGFTKEFLKLENMLSLDTDVCACVRVFKGEFDPQDNSVMTQNGSLYINNSIKFMKGLTEKEKMRYRGNCMRHGFLSIAIIPMRYYEQILGAIHLADERERILPLDTIQFLESTAVPLIGEALHRFNMEEALRGSEASLYEAQRVAHLGNWDWNIQKNQLHWSDEIYRIFGLSPQQFGATYEAFLDSVHHDDREAVKAAVNEALYEKKPYSIDHRIVLPDSTVRTVHGQAEVTFDEDGKPVWMLGTVQDITDLKRAGEELKRSYEQFRNLSAHLQSVREEERINIAREIHDELGQALTALKIDTSMLGTKLYPDHKPLIEKTESMIKKIDETIQSVKRICTELRPAILDHFGLSAAIEWHTGEFEKLTGIKSDISFEPKEIIADQDISIAVFRILQEALTNVARHAEATAVKINLKLKDGNIILEVEDNGKGITEMQISNHKSFGLLGIKERVNFLGGDVKINGLRNKGTNLTVSIPLRKKEGLDNENTNS